MSQRQHSRGRGIAPGSVAAVTFDVTHTLVHSPDLARIYHEVLARHGITVSQQGINRKIPWVWKEMSCRADMRRDRFGGTLEGARDFWFRFLERLCQLLETPPPSRFAAAELFDRFAKAAAWQIYPDVLPALELLKEAGMRLGVVSNWDHRLPILLGRLGLQPSFDVVEYSSSTGLEKPNPEIFLSCLRRLGVPPERTLHVGDSVIEDVEGAQAAGCSALLVDRRAQRDTLGELLAPVLPQRGAGAKRGHLKILQGKGQHVSS